MGLSDKLNTLLRARSRDWAQHWVDAHGLKIYAQEITDAETVLAERRNGMIQQLALRRELEFDMERLTATLHARETELSRLTPAQREPWLLQEAAEEIAALEQERECLKLQHAGLCEQVSALETGLRELLREIRHHRRELKRLTAAERGAMNVARAAPGLQAQVISLQDTRERLSQRLASDQALDTAAAEVRQRLDQPLEQALERAGVSDRSLRVARVLSRLQSKTDGEGETVL